MRFIMLFKSDERTEAGALPSEREIAAMQEYNQALVDAGALLEGEGLHPSSRGFRVKFHEGKPTIVPGPFGEPGKIVAGYLVIEAKSREEALDWTMRVPFGADEGGQPAEIEVRPLYELADFPVSEEESGWREQEQAHRDAGWTVNPVNPEWQQFVGFRLADAETESETSPAPSEELLTAMGEYNEQMINAGMMISGEGLKPSSEGFRVRWAGGKRTVIDGPFPLDGNLVAGYSRFQARSMEEAMAWVKRWPPLDGHGEVELEVRRVMTTDEFDMSPELRATEDGLRAQVAGKRPTG
jgi:hypothetical protein